MNITQWLPTTVKEMRQRGWEKPDVIFFTGDAYVDHPSFGTAMISRVMEMAGMKVVIVPQPNWQDDLRDFKKFGEPTYFFAVTAGCMDSMVNHYTAHKRLRSDDSYSPGGKAGFRPDYATIVYSNILKKLYPHIPVIIGGIEASQRRFTHYDYWKNNLEPTIMWSSKADLLVYGMGEKPIETICRHLLNGGDWDTIKKISQVGYIRSIQHSSENEIRIPSHNDCVKSKELFAESFRIIETEANRTNPKILVQPIDEKFEVVINPPYPTLTSEELDKYYALPFTRLPHPKYKKRGPIPAYEMIRHSVTIHRGCFGGCSFCTIVTHQGKFIASRSENSILEEVKKITQTPDFKGYISDLGGPSANMYRMTGKDKLLCKQCKRPSCIYPNICKNLDPNHSHLINLYSQAEKIPGVKKIFIGSGIRYDLLYSNGSLTVDGKLYAQKIIKDHISGRLKVAPEHTSSKVLSLMRKPSFELYKKFYQFFVEENNRITKKQQLIPYFISSHPGCTIQDMFELHQITRNMGALTDQIQDFTPTPMTLASTMFYSGLDPYTGQKIYVAQTLEEKRAQKDFFFAHNPEKRAELLNYLRKTKHHDIILKLQVSSPKRNK